MEKLTLKVIPGVEINYDSFYELVKAQKDMFINDLFDNYLTFGITTDNFTQLFYEWLTESFTVSDNVKKLLDEKGDEYHDYLREEWDTYLTEQYKNDVAEVIRQFEDSINDLGNNQWYLSVVRIKAITQLYNTYKR